MNLTVSEYYKIYQNDFNLYVEKIQQGLLKYDPKLSFYLDEAQKCYKQMESELSSLPNIAKRSYNEQLKQYKQTLLILKQDINIKGVLSSKTNIDGYSNEKQQLQQYGLLKTGNVILETGEIINDIERLTSETENIAVNVNENMNVGTKALQGSKNHQNELRSHLRKSQLTIGIMNRKLVIDKVTLFGIVILFAIIDVLALYLKLT